MLRMKGLALAWLVGGSLALSGPMALADDSASARKDHVDDRASATKDRIDDNTKAEKKAVDKRADQEKDNLDRRADREKNAVDTSARAEKASIEHENQSDKTGAKEEVSDAWITSKIKARMVGDKELKGSDISVDTDKSGEVTLSGTVDSRMVRHRADDIAEDVSGVRYVQNNLRVREPARVGTAAGTTGAAGIATTGGAATAIQGTRRRR